MTSRCRPVVICGPSGVGKGTLIELLQKQFPAGKFGFSISHTTRKPREGEQDGVHYNFTTVDAIKKEIEAGKFVEYAEVHGNYYGTSVAAVQTVQDQGKICLLDIDIQGAQNVKKSDLDALYIFISPPSMEELEKRLRGRGTEKEEDIIKRLGNAQKEMDYGAGEGNFDCVLVNNDLNKTLDEMVAKFKEWYPDMLNIPPPVVDPLSFPQTDEGLQALLTEIDKDCPLESYVQTELTYHASNIHVPAAKTLDIPLPPVEFDGSKVEWSVTLVDEYHERLDIGFGLAVIVDGAETMVREMGRILAPTQSKKDSGEDDATASTTGSAADVSAKGKFTVANSAPVGLLMKFDNRHAWLKSKSVSYSFTIISPVDENMIQRSLRAKSVVPKLEEGKEAAAAAKENERARSDALAKMKKEMEEKASELSKQLDDEQKNVQEIQKSSDEAEKEAMEKANEIKDTLALVKVEADSIEDCTSSITALEEECARLRKQWEELKIKRQAHESERLKLEQQAELRQKERLQLQEEIAAKKEEAAKLAAKLNESEKVKESMESNLADLETEMNARKADEEKYENELKFIKKLEAALALRFVEQKS
eukprot:scaffold844_cov142-Skeletonema_menzelii.AAC.2